MRALLVDDSAPQRFRLGTVPEPSPGPHEVLVSTTAVAVNPTDLALLGTAPNGTVLGYELSGTVHRQAADGTGPPLGSRVTGLVMGGAWAERVAVGTDQLAVVPDEIDLPRAAAVPIAALSALRALRAGGPVLGRRIMVTGATGAVGSLAVQLAAVGGATEITAVVRSATSTAELSESGATRVVTDPLRSDALVDTVVDTVGGDVLVRAFARTAAGGTVVSVGRASGEDIVLPAAALEGAGGRSGRSIRTFFMPDEAEGLSTDLDAVLRLIAGGRLAVGIDHAEEMAGDLPLLRSGAWSGRLVLTTNGTAA